MCAQLDLSEIRTIGSGIFRPEGVMALNDGSLYAADSRGCCAHIHPDGDTSFFGFLKGVPNGVCVDLDDNCIVANIGSGQVQSASPDGKHTVLMTEAEGMPISTPNFPYLDFKGRLWVTNSTNLEDLNQALQSPVDDGAVVVLENGHARIAATGICFANGVTLDEKEEYLYVAETMKRRILRFSVSEDGSLSNRRVYGPDPLSEKGFPDGIAFDTADNLWVTFPGANAVGYITANENLEIYLQDPEDKIIHRPSNICFGGQDLRTAYIGSLAGNSIPYFQVPHPGMRLVHQS